MRNIFILFPLIFLCSCTEKFQYITVQEFNAFNENEFELIDVRTTEEFQSGHISGSINIGPGSIPTFSNCSDTTNLSSEFVTVICFSNKI